MQEKVMRVQTLMKVLKLFVCENLRRFLKKDSDRVFIHLWGGGCFIVSIYTSFPSFLFTFVKYLENRRHTRHTTEPYKFLAVKKMALGT